MGKLTMLALRSVVGALLAGSVALQVVMVLLLSRGTGSTEDGADFPAFRSW